MAETQRTQTSLVKKTKLSIKMSKKDDLSDFEHVIVQMVPDRLVSFQNLMIFWDFSRNTTCRVSLNAQQVITEA